MATNRLYLTDRRSGESIVLARYTFEEGWHLREFMKGTVEDTILEFLNKVSGKDSHQPWIDVFVEDEQGERK